MPVVIHMDAAPVLQLRVQDVSTGPLRCPGHGRIGSALNALHVTVAKVFIVLPSVSAGRCPNVHPPPQHP